MELSKGRYNVRTPLNNEIEIFALSHDQEYMAILSGESKEFLRYAKKSGPMEKIEMNWMEDLKKRVEEYPDKEKMKSVTDDLWECPAL